MFNFITHIITVFQSCAYTALQLVEFKIKLLGKYYQPLPFFGHTKT